MNTFRISDFFLVLDESVYGVIGLLIPLVAMALFGFAIYVIKGICCYVFNY